MSFFSPILAQVDDDGVDTTDALRNRLITFGAYAAVMLVILIWAIFIRKQKNKRRRVHRRKPHNWQVSENSKAHGRHRHRHHQKPELPKNPNRAEAGGLPPRRPDVVPPQGS